MTDRFAHTAPSIDGPAAHAFSVTPDDNTDLEEVTRGLYCGTAGDIALRMQSGAEVVFTNVAEGSFLPVRASRILATGTTAAAIVGLV
ncbi:hypothetical protein [Rhizobium sp. L1K21]|uniref:spike base protein, RCAP_Rcc01079 family n=1 Tax=Rhizobium sp. L1K21 TaxID=2954933 RepID=UPI002092BD0A|nr:hypothetical protein [Rhizobium sp. L1K21]MCO6185531.1 hypothetical protein [Rhizobium sp. L1K21]